MGNPTKAIAIAGIACLVLIGAEKFGASRAPSIEPGLHSFDSSGRNAPSSVRGKFNGKLVFSSDRQNSALSIWTMNPDGSSPVRLTDGKSRSERLPSFAHVYDDFPAWSPDGTRIAFISNRDNDNFLYVMNQDGSNIHVVTDKVPNPSAPAWSPDGGRIALAGGSPIVFEPAKPFMDIYVVNIDGSGLTKLTTDSGLNSTPAWSPDGQQIAYSSNRDPDGRAKIWVINADGTHQARLTDIRDSSKPTFYGDRWPSWSPDGTKILFNGYRDFNGSRDCGKVNCSELFVMNSDGTNERPLTNDPNRGGVYSSPKWSPDGTKIVTGLALGRMADRRAGIDRGRAIIVMNADGSNQVNVSNRSDKAFFDVSADWQPLSSPRSSSSSVLGFSAPFCSAYEDVGSIEISVKRTGDVNDPASCSFGTEDGTATVKHNYAPTFGTLIFGSGEPSKTISIPFTDKRTEQSNPSFEIRLFDNEGNGTFAGGIREAAVSIMDRDQKSVNPI